MSRSELHLVESTPLRYLLSLPSGPRPVSGARPVLCFLHGYDEAVPADIHVGVRKHGPLREGSSPLALERFIVVAPQLPRAGDLWHLYADPVHALVRQVQALHGGDPERTYLTGFSFGGNGVLDLALVKRSFWSALWPVDPTRVPVTDPELPVWLSVGGVARYNKRHFIEQLQLREADGGAGGASRTDRLYTDRGEDHVASATSAYREDRIYRWLLTKHLRGSGTAGGSRG
jgi:acetyl esterase/lipase